MNRNRQRGPRRRGGRRITEDIKRLLTFPSGTEERIENVKYHRPHIEPSPTHRIIDKLLNTASEVMGELHKSPQGREELSEPDRKPLSYPLVDSALCTGCGLCADNCPSGAISVNRTAVINDSLCTGCRKCFDVCPRGAITFVEEGKSV